MLFAFFLVSSIFFHAYTRYTYPAYLLLFELEQLDSVCEKLHIFFGPLSCIFRFSKVHLTSLFVLFLMLASNFLVFMAFFIVTLVAHVHLLMAAAVHVFVLHLSVL